ncbi:hypothetical protein IIA15_09405 [candidate division TA06 bacterium]|nr:hypothetical protein [candidate division TA06 bacterium]
MKVMAILLLTLFGLGSGKDPSKTKVTTPTKDESPEQHLISAKDPSSPENLWEPYAFKGTEHFKYEITFQVDDEKKEGVYILDLKKGKGEEMTIHIKGEWEKNTFESTVTVSEDEFYGALMGQMMMNPAAAPLLVTLFTPWWSMYFVGRDWKVGSGWSFSEGEKSISFKVEEECEHAGVKGLKGVMRQNGEIMVETCVSPQVALPLAAHFRGDEAYSLVLTEYEE